ncbi:MAG: Na/Pi cotransporter family protein [Vallitaleaceae bacterium]|nr:Na/Pi cotransporter family protein [Vallitaleaceae bacterium]
MTTETFQEILFQIFAFVGGFGMFLYGMHIMAQGLEQSAGPKMKSLLKILTSNRLLAVGVGALVTAIIQSSSATTVMVVGFVNASILNLTQAVGVIMGANIGTTITGWIVSSSEWAAFLKPAEMAPLAIGIGAMLLFFGRGQTKKQVGEIIIGFGLLFIGLELMGDAIKPYRDSQIFKDAFTVLGSNPIFGILAGFLVTAVIQSSSASVGILQTVALAGMVPWNAAVFIILGQNIGTCVTAMLSSIGANKTAKRAAVIHLLFNLIGTVFFGIIAIVYFSVFNRTLGDTQISATEISVFHTIFNIANTVLLFPFAMVLVRLSEKIVTGEDILDNSQSAVVLRHLDDRILETPIFAVENAIKEVVSMGYIALENVRLATEAMVEKNPEKIKQVEAAEKDINKLDEMITQYLIKINNLPITEKQHLVVNHLFNTVNDIERVGDHASNLAQLANYKIENDITFSELALSELTDMSDYTIETLRIAVEAREKNDSKLVHKVEDREDIIDTKEEELREKHIKRLSNYECTPSSSVVFLEAINHFERISDHALNIAQYIQEEIFV